MAVSQQNPIITHTANGIVDTFAYNFYVIQIEDLHVFVDGVEQIIGITVGGIGLPNGGTVVFDLPPLNGALVRIQRRGDIDRSIDYIQGGFIIADTLDVDIDRTVHLIQDLDSLVIKQDSSGNFDLTGGRVVNGIDPVDANDLTTKAYVDSEIVNSVSSLTGSDISLIDVGDNLLATNLEDAVAELFNNTATVSADLISHQTDTSVHYQMNTISITESQISNLRSYSLDDHVHGEYEPSFSKNSAFNKVFGVQTNTVCQGDDARLSDARLPLTHTHALSEIYGTASIKDLNDVYDLMNPVAGQVLTFDAINGWTANDASSGVTDHTLLTNIGANTHVQIDAHISDSNIHFTQGAISIAESQISDLGNYETVDAAIMRNVVEDVTPQLGGDLDVNEFYIRGGENAGVFGHGGRLGLYAGDHTNGTSSRDGGSCTLRGGHTDGTGSGATGGNIFLRGGYGYGAGSGGGSFFMYGGDARNDTGRCGDVLITGGSQDYGHTSSNNAGKVRIQGGRQHSTGRGGDIIIRGGGSRNSLDSGNVIIEGGEGYAGVGTGKVQIHSNQYASEQAELQFWNDTNTAHTTGNYVSLKAPATTDDRTWILPMDDPSAAAGKLLTTSSSGVLSFVGVPAHLHDTDYLRIDGSTTMTGAIDTDVGTFKSNVVDGATAVGFSFETANILNDTGSKIFSFDVGGTEQAFLAANASQIYGAFGSNNVDAGFAFGSGNNVSGNNSVAFGQNHNLSGQSSAIFGFGNTVPNGTGNTVGGLNNTIGGLFYNTGFGLANTIAAGAFGCVALGLVNNVSPPGFGTSVAVGESNTITSNKCYAFGQNNNFSADNSAVVGSNNVLTSKSNFVLGKTNTVDGLKTTILGSFHNSLVAHTDHVMVGTGINSTDKLTSTGSNQIIIGANSTVPTMVITDGGGVIGGLGTVVAKGDLIAEQSLTHQGTTAGFFNTVPVAKPTALTASKASVVDATYGAEEQDVINNLRTRLDELETKLQSLGLIT